MDPNANLKEQLELAEQLIDKPWKSTFSVDAERLAELVLELDFWIKNGGFLPSEWRKK